MVQKTLILSVLAALLPSLVFAQTTETLNIIEILSGRWEGTWQNFNSPGSKGEAVIVFTGVQNSKATGVVKLMREPSRVWSPHMNRDLPFEATVNEKTGTLELVVSETIPGLPYLGMNLKRKQERGLPVLSGIGTGTSSNQMQFHKVR